MNIQKVVEAAAPGTIQVSQSRSNILRQRRLRLFEQFVGERGSIIDLGGTASFWRQSGKLYGNPNFEITVVNLELQEGLDRNLRLLHGNGCNLPQFSDRAFDFVHSNSVIEHVGGWQEMQHFAGEVRRLAPAYFVQTPNYWFPIEPHHRLPFVHWLSPSHRAALLRRIGRVPQQQDKALAAVERIRLLKQRQMSLLFPDAKIVPERLFPFTKSWLAIRD